MSTWNSVFPSIKTIEGRARETVTDDLEQGHMVPCRVVHVPHVNERGLFVVAFESYNIEQPQRNIYCSNVLRYKAKGAAYKLLFFVYCVSDVPTKEHLCVLN